MQLECARNCRFQPPLYYNDPRKYFKNYATERTPSIGATGIPAPTAKIYFIRPAVSKVHTLPATQILDFLLS